MATNDNASQTHATRRPLGELLRAKNLIGQGHIDLALQDQKITGQRLGETLERLAFVSEFDIANTIAEQEGRPYVDVDQVTPQEDTLRLFNMNLCLTQHFLPLAHGDGRIRVASANQEVPELERLLTRMTGLRPEILQGERGKIQNAVQNVYYFLENPVERLLERELQLLANDIDDVRALDTTLSHLFQLAVKNRATDIHIRPVDRAISIAFRIDGVMQSMFSVPLKLRRLITTIKMRAEMDISEQRLPQDGSFSDTILNNPYDFRVSTTVCPYGENMVIRVLSTRSNLMALSQLGFDAEDVQRISDIFNAPYGIVLLTGPTGSGKTTTLYAALRTLDLTQKNVITVENPIEYQLPLVRQTEINPKAGYNFANAVRFFLRHDPDVILIGEIRDADTAQTAVSASETGHLVLSTLHANTALGALPRMRSLGVAPFMLAESLVAVLSQRLLRAICPSCREAYTPTPAELEYLQDPGITTLYRGVGCSRCKGTGYYGRTVAYEILRPNAELRARVSRDAPIDELEETALRGGLETLFMTSRRKVIAGVTSVAEMRRVVG